MTTVAHAASPATGTRARIEGAALELFFDKGYAATSMREVAVASGLTVGAIYNHFPSKEAILVAIMERVHTELERLLVEARDAAGRDARAQLAALVRAHVLFHTRYRHDARVANAEIGSLPEPVRRQIVAVRRRMREMFAASIRAGVRARLFQVPDVTVTTVAIINMGIRVADWFEPTGRLGDIQIAEHHATLALRMVERR